MENTLELVFKTMHQLINSEGGDGCGIIILKHEFENRTYKTIAKQFEEWQLKETDNFWNMRFENDNSITFTTKPESNITFTNKEGLYKPTYHEFKFVI